MWNGIETGVADGTETAARIRRDQERRQPPEISHSPTGGTTMSHGITGSEHMFSVHSCWPRIAVTGPPQGGRCTSRSECRSVAVMSHVVVSNLAYAHPGGDLLFSDVSFKLSPGRHAGLIGANGVGKTTLMRVLAGELAAADGDADIGSFALSAHWRRGSPPLRRRFC